MQNKIKIQIPNGILDIKSDDIGFELVYSIAEIQNIEAKDSPYSKSIIIPGSKNNNYHLGNIYDINETYTYFNPNYKTPARVTVNDTVVMDGYMKLNRINILKNVDSMGNHVEYEVQIFDEVSNFFSEIKDKKLEELDFSEYDHKYTFSSITNSWYHSYLDGYTYPNLYKNNGNMSTTDFKPAIFHRNYLEKIAEQAGFSLGGSLIDTATTAGYHYSKEIIPFIGSNPTLPQAEIDRRKFRAGMSTSAYTYDSKVIMDGLNNMNISLGYPLTNFTKFDDDSTSPNFDNDNNWNTTTNTWLVDSTGKFNILGRLNIETTFKTHREIENISGSSSTIYITFADEHHFPTGANIKVEIKNTTNYNGVYASSFNHDPNTMSPKTVRLNGITYIADEFSGTFCWEAWQQVYTGYNGPSYNGGYSYKFNLKLLKNGQSFYDFYSLNQSAARGNGSTGGLPNSAFNSANNYEQKTNNYININKYNNSFVNGELLSLQISAFDGGNFGKLRYVNGTTISTAKSIPVLFEWKIIDEFNSEKSTIYNEVIGSQISDNDDIYINNFIPKEKKQKEIITDLSKRKNAYFSKDKNNNKKIIIDTRDDYYSKGVELDWTNKKHYGFTDKIQLLSETQNKEILFSYKNDNDAWNKIYSENSVGETYGQERVVFAGDVATGEKKIETPFAPTQLIYETSAYKGYIVPAFNYLTTKSLRVLYFPGEPLQTLKGYYNFSWVHPTNGVTTTPLNYYCYAGHYDNPFNPKVDTNYGEVPYVGYAEQESTTNNTQYNMYWSSYMRQIAEGRMVTSQFWLDENDISFIKDNLNAKIFVKDSWFYVNKINYNPTKKAPSQVELIKIVDGGLGSHKSEKLTKIKNLTAYEAQIKTSITTNGGSSTGGGTQTSYDISENTTLSSNSLISGVDNYIGEFSENSMIIGNNNIIGDNTNQSGIIGGSGNTIVSGVEGGWIIGANDKTIENDGEIWLGNNRLINGQFIPGINIIDGGENSNANLFSEFPTNLVDGGENTLRELNSNIINKINGNI